jgi:hypothetical protein
MRKLLLLLPLILLVACGDEQPYSDAEVVDRAKEIEPGTPTFGVYNALKAMGTPVEVGDEVRQPFFDEPGRALVINGSPVELYEFGSRNDAGEAAKLIAPDGTVSGQPAWTTPVHWYRSELVLALYRGNDPSVISAMNATLGAQFAGAAAP